MEEWSNNACLGYTIRSAMRLGYTEEQIKHLVNMLRSEFDWTAVEEAKEFYNNSPY